MESNQNVVAEPVAVLGTHVVNIDAKGLAGLFGKPVEAAESQRRRSESQLASFYDALVNSPEHLKELVKRPTAKEKENLPIIEGKPRPQVIAELVNVGYAVDTAETMFSNMIRMREAWSLLQFVPPKGTAWNKAYEMATKKVGEYRKDDRKAKQEDSRGAFEGAHIAQALKRLPPEKRDDPVARADAVEQGMKEADEAALTQRCKSVATAAVKALGSIEFVPDLIDVLQQMVTDWQTKKSSTMQAAGATETPRGIEAPAQPQPQRAAA